MQNVQTHGYEVAVLDDPEPRAKRDRDQLDSLGPKALATSHIGTLDSVGLEHGFLAEAKVPNFSGGTFNTVASYTVVPIPEDVVLAPSSPTGLMSRHVLPPVDPSSAATLQVLVRWVLDNAPNAPEPVHAVAVLSLSPLEPAAIAAVRFRE